MKFLVFQHVPHENPGRITQYCEREGIDLDTVEFWKPYKIPSVKDYNSLVIMGGPMSVYDNESYPSMMHETDSIIDAVKNNIPILGFCLGSQLIANALGARVYSNVINDRRIKEVGYFPVDLTEEGKKDPLFTGLSSPLTVLQWHGDAFDIPDRAVRLATAELCANQAFRYNSAYGLLFHFEFMPEMVQSQLEIEREWVHKDNKADEEEILRQALENEGLMEKQFRKLFDNLLKLID